MVVVFTYLKVELGNPASSRICSMASKGEFALGSALEQANKNKAKARKALGLLLEPGRHNLIETIQWIQEAAYCIQLGSFLHRGKSLLHPNVANGGNPRQ